MRRLATPFVLFVVLSAADPALAATRRVFVTSASGTGNLGSWPEAGSATGLDAGDAICQELATDAGLANPTNFRAWLSSSTTDAYCRIHGLTGKKATNCGQAVLPESAGPWLRTDGADFGAAIGQLLYPDQQVFLPPRVNENEFVVHASIWTGTESDGEVHPTFGTCNGWVAASSSEDGAIGATDHTGWGWGSAGAGNCDASNRLLCFEIVAGDPLPPRANWGRLAFATSALGQGDLSTWSQAGGATGLAAGDAICVNLATAGGLPNPSAFKAWLSTGTVDARDRFVHDGPWMRVDRVRLAATLAGLTDGLLTAPLNVTETGSYLGNDSVFTGTDDTGVAVPERCSDWMSSDSGEDGQKGTAEAADADWTFRDISGSGGSCGGFGHLYCLQDLPLVFADGFESGDTAAWSAVAP